MPEAAARWYGMERAISHWLDANAVEYVGEHRGGHPERQLDYDFILVGEVPTIVEVKYARFRNMRFSDALVQTAVAAFGRCRFLLIVVGEVSQEWVDASEAATYFFDPSAVNVPDSANAELSIDRAAGTFVARLMQSLVEAPVLGSGSRSSGAGIPYSELSRWHERYASPIEELFPDDPLNALKTVAASFRTITGSIESNENVVDHELSQLKAEYSSGHFTSCALRLGRCLELVVYAFAHKVGISPSTGQFRSLQAVDDKLRALTGRMADLAETDPTVESAQYIANRISLRDSIIDLQSSLSTVLSQLDDVAREDREVRGPDNLQAILRRALRHLGDGPGSAEAKQRLGRLLKGDRAREIIALRNAAAHGDPGLARREVGKDDITRQLLVVADYIQELAVVVQTSRLRSQDADQRNDGSNSNTAS